MTSIRSKGTMNVVDFRIEGDMVTIRMIMYI